MDNSQNKLISFNGDIRIKNHYLNELYDWLDNKQRQKTPEELVNEIFNNSIIIKPSNNVFENFELFPEKLGLPLWLGNLFRTINHHNSNLLESKHRNYQHKFYVEFYNACKVGVDYTLLFYKWETYILNELPNQEKDREQIKNVIILYEKELSGEKVNIKDWEKASIDLYNFMQQIDEFYNVSEDILLKEKELLENVNVLRKTRDVTFSEKNKEYYDFVNKRKAYGKITWNSCRTAFLSVQEAIDVTDVWASSSEALVEALYSEALINGLNSNKIDKYLNIINWQLIMDELITMLLDWNGDGEKYA